jgi:putative transposase
MTVAHPWRSRGEKRTIVSRYEPPPEIMKYLEDMQEATRYALLVAYVGAMRRGGSIPSPITLRRQVRDWFYVKFLYARHHINPVCRAAVAMLRSYKRNHHGRLGIPQVRKLAMRIDSELFKVTAGSVRITLQPYRYAWLPINTRNKHYEEYTSGRQSELLLTDRVLCITFAMGGSDREKALGGHLAASDLNFHSVDSTTASSGKGDVKLTGVRTTALEKIVQVQNDFSRRRRMLQKHVRNPAKRNKKLRETRGRQRNRVRDAIHQLTTAQVKENPDTSFLLEDLTGIRRRGTSSGRKTKGKGRSKGGSRRFVAYLNRWPYRMYQRMIEYKSPRRTIYVDPRGTSSECPVCGGRLEHPTWGVSRCRTCGVDYDRNRLASLAIFLRGLRLCGYPFTVSADASWPSMKSEYLYAGGLPGAAGAGGTEETNAPNKTQRQHQHYLGF